MQCDVKEALVIAKVQINLSSIVKNVNLTWENKMGEYTSDKE